MSNAILDLIVREQNKLERRRATVEATKVEIEILGSNKNIDNKLLRQEASVKDSLGVLKKLNAANK